MPGLGLGLGLARHLGAGGANLIAPVQSAAGSVASSSLAASVTNNVSQNNIILTLLNYAGSATSDPFTAGLPSGFALRGSPVNYASISGQQAWAALAWKRAGVSEGNSWTFTASGTVTRLGLALATFFRVNTTSAFDPAAYVSDTGSSTTPSNTGVTTLTDDAYAIFACAYASISSAEALGALTSGWSQIVENHTSNFASMFLGGKLIPASGAVGSVGGTFAASKSWCTFTDALKPQ